MVCWPHGKPLHSTERVKDVTVHYRWHPLYGQMARVNRSLPIANGELLFCELPDGTRGTLPAWMTDAAACAVLTVGAPVVSLIALQELRVLLDAVAAGASDPTGASMARNMVRRSTPSGRSPSSRSSGRSRDAASAAS